MNGELWGVELTVSAEFGLWGLDPWMDVEYVSEYTEDPGEDGI